MLKNEPLKRGENRESRLEEGRPASGMLRCVGGECVNGGRAEGGTLRHVRAYQRREVYRRDDGGRRRYASLLPQDVAQRPRGPTLTLPRIASLICGYGDGGTGHVGALPLRPPPPLLATLPASPLPADGFQSHSPTAAAGPGPMSMFWWMTGKSLDLKSLIIL